MSKHTPTPWKIGRDPDRIVSDRGVIAVTNFEGHKSNVDAQHIVQCVNSHDELLEAANLFIEGLKGPLWNLEYRENLTIMFEKAIAAAEEKE